MEKQKKNLFQKANIIKQYISGERHFFIITLLVLITAFFIIAVINLLLSDFSPTSQWGVWNGQRLAPAFALRYGFQLYCSQDSGPVIALLYGPVMALAYLPATVARSPTTAIILGQLIAIIFFFLPVFWLLVAKNLRNYWSGLSAFFAFLCFCFLTIVSPALSYSAFRITADAPVLGLSTVACAALYFRKQNENNFSLQLSALFVILAIWTKQTSLPLLFALPLYLLVADGFRCFRQYCSWLCLYGIIISVIFLSVFKAENLIFNMITIPIRCPWKSVDVVRGLFQQASVLLRNSLFPALVVLYYVIFQIFFLRPHQKLKEWMLDNRWTMLVVVALFMAPASILGIVKNGGDINSLSLSVYFLTISAVIVLHKAILDSWFVSLRPVIRMISRLFVILVVGIIIIFNCRYFHSKSRFFNIPEKIYFLRNNAPQLAYEYAKSHPNEVYFPWYILSTFMAEKKFYHFAYGLWDMQLSGFPITNQHFLENIPPKLQLVAYNLQAEKAFYVTGFNRKVEIKELSGWSVYALEELDMKEEVYFRFFPAT